MKIVKRILIGLLAVVALLLIVALFVPRDFKAGSEIIINRPKSEVFEYVKYVKNQDNYGKWQLMDPDMKKTYEGEDGTVGFSYKWDSEVLNQGSQTITKIVEGKRIEAELYFGFGDPAQSYFTTEEIGESQTKIAWGISGRTPYPFNLMSLFFNMDKDFDEGLTNLKNILEK
jgi:hypothetical protein